MRWRPDTCGCVLDVSNDMTRVTSVQPCAIHRGRSVGTIFAAVKRENILKNHTLAIALDQSELAEDVPVEGGTIRRLREGLTFHWTFDSKRVLDVDVVGASQSGRERLESALTLAVPGMARVRRG